MSGIADSGKKAISVGPCGGPGGITFDDGVYSAVKQVVINHGTAIDSIQIEYDKQGDTVWSNHHGGHGGFRTDNVKLNCPDEFLVSINGYYGKIQDWGPTVVRSLTLKSNKKTYGPFGVEQGTCFSFPMSNVKIVGFHGLESWFVDAIGVHVTPLDQRNISDGRSAKEARYLPKNVYESDSTSDSDIDSNDVRTKDCTSKIMPTVEGAIKCGPWGGAGGGAFDWVFVRRINNRNRFFAASQLDLINFRTQSYPI